MELTTPSEIDNRFTYHVPSPDQAELYGQIRGACRDLAHAIVDLTPGCREQSLAITHLEEVVFWANAAVARRS